LIPLLIADRRHASTARRRVVLHPLAEHAEVARGHAAIVAGQARTTNVSGMRARGLGEVFADALIGEGQNVGD
jgi:hypothetical protein